MTNTLSPLQRLANLLPGTDSHKARSAHDTAVDQYNRSWWQLDERGALHANTRARLLSSLAAAQQAMCDTYATGYGAGWTDTPDIVRLYDDRAELLHLLSSTSASDAEGSRIKARRTWEDAFGPVLDDLAAAASDAPAYTQALVRLWFAVAEHVNAEVAETVKDLIEAMFRATGNTNPTPAIAAAA